MRFIKVPMGWDEVNEAGQVIEHFTNEQYSELIHHHIAAHSHEWLQHFSLWYTHGSAWDAAYLLHSWIGGLTQ